MRLEWRRCRGSTVGSVSKGESVKESSRCKSKISSKDERYQKLLYLRSVRANVQGKAVTREATREAKLKRGGMKERFKIEIFITLHTIDVNWKKKLSRRLSLLLFVQSCQTRRSLFLGRLWVY